MKRSEEEIKRLLQATIAAELGVDEFVGLVDAITELLTLRRRLDRDALAAVILHEELKKQPNSFKVADAIIKYMEREDG